MTGIPRRLAVLVTDPIIERFSDALLDGAPDHDWTFLTDPDDPLLPDAVAACDVLVCARLSAEDATGCGARLVQVTGAGLDRVAVQLLPAAACVANTSHHARSIAEHVLMSVMVLERRLLPADAALRGGTWRNLSTDPTIAPHRTLPSLTLGTIGLGDIGAETLRLASAWGMDTLAIRSTPTAPLPDGATPRWVGGSDDLPRLLGDSDVVVVTVPLNGATAGLIGERELTAMRHDAVLVNVARGPVVDQEALYSALTAPPGTGRAIGGAALDVWWGAPKPGRTPPADFPFADLDHVLLTPHFSGHAASTFLDRSRDIAANVNLLAQGAPLLNLVRNGSSERRAHA